MFHSLVRLPPLLRSLNSRGSTAGVRMVDTVDCGPRLVPFRAIVSITNPQVQASGLTRLAEASFVRCEIPDRADGRARRVNAWGLIGVQLARGLVSLAVGRRLGSLITLVLEQ